jgi:hypothetical protein
LQVSRAMEVPLKDPRSMMSLLERVAIEGLLADIRPTTSIELGTSRGGSLRRIAAWSDRTHSFDLSLQVDPGDFPTVTFHVGDSHALLPKLLGELEERRETVQFVLIDGDHTPEGVRRDLLDVLRSPAVTDCAIVLHDTANEAVRHGVESVPFEEFGKVAWADLDFVPTNNPQQRASDGWGGLGMILTDASRKGPGVRPPAAGVTPDPWRHVRGVRRRARRLGGEARRQLQAQRARVTPGSNRPLAPASDPGEIRPATPGTRQPAAGR